ncbi:MAG: ATP-binding cassette domain-containing protein, partial [Desulfobacterales bacterium]|nr:ATP-binding cassette domain-containing protein [Desulfobacterales bacterium]
MTIPPPGAAIKIRELNHSFGVRANRKQVLFDINLDIQPGRIVIMTGPSGSGKTTLLTLVGALRSVQEGSLVVLGNELAGLSAKGLVRVRRKVGFIFQAHNLFDSLTAVQNVKLALRYSDVPVRARQAMAVDILEKVGLEHRLKYKPEALSGGQRQRVAVARGIVHRPRLILADEPTAALDKDTGRQVVNLFRQLAREDNAAILLVTHDNRILDIADRIINMVDGAIASDVQVDRSLEICEFLVKCDVFARNTPAALTEVAQKMEVEKFPAGRVIIRQGDVGDKFYVIRKGKVDVSMTDEKGGQTAAGVLEPGDFFGEIALLKEIPRSATVTALEEQFAQCPGWNGGHYYDDVAASGVVEMLVEQRIETLRSYNVDRALTDRL